MRQYVHNVYIHHGKGVKTDSDMWGTRKGGQQVLVGHMASEMDHMSGSEMARIQAGSDLVLRPDSVCGSRMS